MKISPTSDSCGFGLVLWIVLWAGDGYQLMGVVGALSIVLCLVVPAALAFVIGVNVNKDKVPKWMIDDDLDSTD